MTVYCEFHDLYSARVSTSDSSASGPEGEPRCWLRIRGGEMAELGGKPNVASGYLDIPQAKQLIAGLERFVCQNEDSEPAEPASDEDGFFSSIERVRRRLGLPNSARNWQIMLKAADELDKAHAEPVERKNVPHLLKSGLRKLGEVVGADAKGLTTLGLVDEACRMIEAARMLADGRTREADPNSEELVDARRKLRDLVGGEDMLWFQVIDEACSLLQDRPRDGQSQDRLERLTAEKNQLQALVEAQEAQLKYLSQQAEAVPSERPPTNWERMAVEAQPQNWRRDWWMRAYAHVLETGAGQSDAAEVADAALRSMDSRFPG